MFVVMFTPYLRIPALVRRTKRIVEEPITLVNWLRPIVPMTWNAVLDRSRLAASAIEGVDGIHDARYYDPHQSPSQLRIWETSLVTS